jgi:hypothetical protein
MSPQGTLVGRSVGLDQFGLDSYVDPDGLRLYQSSRVKPSLTAYDRYVENRHLRFPDIGCHRRQPTIRSQTKHLTPVPRVTNSAESGYNDQRVIALAR